MNAAAGMTWIVAGNVLVRLLGLVGQILLGWFLLPEDFGVYAFALAIATAVSALRSGGITQVAVQQGQTFNQQIRHYFRYALAFNLLAMAILIGVAIPYLFNNSTTGIVLTGIALSIPAGTHASIARIKLTVDGRFRELAIIGLWSALIWQTATVSLAIAGMGAASFALPPLLQALFESVTIWRVAAISSQQTLTEKPRDYRGTFRQCRWLMLSAVMLALATTGDYFAVSLLASPVIVGTYFFSFQLVVALSSPIISGFEAVLPNYFLSRDAGKTQLDAYMTMVRRIAVVGIPLSIGTALVAPVAIHLLWQGKWDGAAAAAQTLALCIPAWIVTAAGRTLMEAKAMWRSRFGMMATYGTGGMLSAAMGALLGDVSVIALCVTLFYIGFALTQHLYLCRSEVRSGSALGGIVIPMAINAMAFAISVPTLVLVQSNIAPAMSQAILLSVFCIVSGLANAIAFGKEWSMLFAMLPRRAVAISAQR